MKKTLKLMGFCALAVLALAGCKKEQPNNGKTSVKAAINQPTGNAKTGVAGLNLVWNSGDRIKVYSDDRSEVAEFTTTDNNVTEATFTTQAEMEVTDGFYAFYPSDDVTYAGGNFVLTLSDQQTGARNTFGADTYPMYATYASDKFTFHSPCALLAVAMNGTATIGSIVLTGGPDEKLNGTYTFNPSDMANSTLSDTGSNTITLSFGQSGLQLTNVNDTAYFALPAGKLANGFTVTFKGLDGGNLLTKTASANPNNTTAAETILRMPAVTVNAPNVINLSTLTADYEAQDGDILTGTLTAHHNITVAADATITLRNVSINPGHSYKSPHGACISCDNDATIVLEGDNDMYVWTEQMPCIYIATGKTLTITGNGSLNASAGSMITAAIGGCYSSGNSCGNIVIESGNITASAGSCAAIGAGFNGNCGNITINGGTVTATSTGASGIGCGNQMCFTCGDITINGGTVMASGSRAGIGGGYQSNCGDITITGGTIIATGVNGSGIGAGTEKSGTWGYCGNITISGGNVTASSTYGVGIGGGHQANCGDILISGGTVTATGGNDYVAIGGSTNYTCGSITITEGVTSVTATKGANALRCIGLGNGDYAICGTVTIGGIVYPNGATPNQADGVTFVYPAPAPTLPEGAIDGKFTIDATGKQVYFAQGNLQYLGSSWKFADNQWEYFGNTQSDGHRDLFGWGTKTTPDNISNSGYSWAEWGENAITNGGNAENSGWYTMTRPEWQYLFKTRTDASQKYGFATITIGSDSYIGFVILPDTWTLPSGCSFTPATHYTSEDGGWGSAADNTYDAAQWSDMESAGAVFLPASGSRNQKDNNTVSNAGASGFYWTQTSNGYGANVVYFDNEYFSYSSGYTYMRGYSVRLVKDAN